MELENGVHAYVECGYLAEAHNPPEYGSSDNRLTVYGKEGYVYAETDGFWGACTKATNGRLIEGKDPGWRNHQQIPRHLTIQSLQSGWRMIQKFTAATLIQHITDMKFWRECACQQ